MGISWYGEIMRVFIEFIGYDFELLNFGYGTSLYILITRIFVLLKFVPSHFFSNLKSSDY